MTKLSHEIFTHHQIRKSKAQKSSFIELISSYIPEARIECSGLLKSRNIIIGDISTAKVIYTAHYDTCAVLPFPNFITPLNLFPLILYNILIGLGFFVLVFALSFTLAIFDVGAYIALLANYALLILLVYLMLFGKANKSTANDNTSGVITLIELYFSMTETERESALFVFFDHEEAGLFGSKQFKKKHEKEIARKLIMNFDCVSDGDDFLFAPNKKCSANYAKLIETAFSDTETKKVIKLNGKRALYPSDQMHFVHGVGVAALNHKKYIGYYMDKIHTKHDTVFMAENIEFLVEGSLRLHRMK